MSITLPIIVDLGRTQEDQIGSLREGEGPLRDDVEEVMRLVRRDYSPDSGNKVFVPIVAVYRRAG